ncbi:MAG: hypothetical protein OHK0046_39990 [Anaerolineae bacterium]
MGQPESTHVDEVITWNWYDGKSDAAEPIHQQGVDALNRHLPPLSNKRVGFESGWLPYGLRIMGEMHDITAPITAMRRSKYPDELALIRAAIQANMAGIEAGRAVIQPGISELEVYNAVWAAAVKSAGTGIVPQGDFASGPRAFGGGGPATSRILEAGDVMIIDLFPVINGYKGDFTATIAVTDQISEEQKTLETALHAAIEAGEGVLKPGAVAGDVYRAVYASLQAEGFAAHFPHHAGHGLGLGHPDAPYFVPNSTEVLQVGDVVTLEPGAYNGKSYGARIEHNYLITETGCERLTSHKTTLI